MSLKRTETLPNPTESPATRRLRVRLMPALPIVVLALMVTAAAAAPLLTPFDPVRNDLASSMLPPSWENGGNPDHLLGTDLLGRDVFTRLLYGARVSFLVATFSLLIAVSIGTTVGVASGYLGGSIDSILMRLVDIVLALPTIIVALALAVALGPSFRNLVLILGLLTWPRIARLIRGETLVLKNADFIRYARTIGVSTRVILRRHLFPNVAATLLVATTLEIGHVILTEATLSFLGAGLPSPQASWGVMIDDGRALIATGWWIALFPGLAITLAVLSLNSLSDWLRDYLDPRTSRT